MTRYVVDASAVLQLAADAAPVALVAPAHELLAPTLLRSQTLSALHEAVHRGELSADVALERLERVSAIKIRLLGERGAPAERLEVRRPAWLARDLRRRVRRPDEVA